MFQLKWDKNFNDVVEDYEEVINAKLPSSLDDFVINYFKSRMIRYWDQNNNPSSYCPKCFRHLLFGHFCHKCKITYMFNPQLKKKLIDSNRVDYTEFDCTNKNNYCLYYFDVENEETILYMIYYNLYINIPNKSFSLYRKKVYEFHINEDGISSLDGELYSIQDFVDNFSISNEDYINLIYIDNLDVLKNSTLYKHSYLWELKDIFNTTINYAPNLHNLIEYPLFHPEFEYLIKLGLYYIALNETNDVTFNGSFKDTFHVEKSKLKHYEYSSLSLCHLWLINQLNIKSKDKLNRLKLEFDNIVNRELAFEYIKQQNLNIEDVFNYLDYLEICRRFMEKIESDATIEKLSKDKDSIFYPKDYKNRRIEFNNYFKDQIKKINDWYEKEYNILKINSYEDDEYIIRPLKELDEIFQEAASQHNCLESYIDYDGKGLHQIYFMRKKDNPNKSFITIEVKNNKIWQALAKFNEEPEDNIKKILELWESKLIKVEFENE